MNTTLLTALVCAGALSIAAAHAAPHHHITELDAITESAPAPAVWREASTADLATTRALAARADAVFIGEVVDIAHQVSLPDARGVRLPFTLVTWHVLEGVRGVASGQTYTARFLGGPLGEKVLTVTEIPVFERGDRDLLFIRGNGTRGCPLVEGARGRVQLSSASGETDGLSPGNVSRTWVSQVLESIRDAGLDVAPGVSVPALHADFVFEMPQRASAAELETAHARALRRAVQAHNPIDEERRAVEANGGNPVLPR